MNCSSSGLVPQGLESYCLAESCSLLAYWRVLSPTTEPRRFFLHAVDEAGSIMAQFDGLDAPATYWQAGDILVQEYCYLTKKKTPTELRLGVYDPRNGRRLLLAGGQDHINFFRSVEIGEMT